MSYTSCQPHHRALPPFLPVMYSKRFSRGINVTPALPCPLLYIPFLPLFPPNTPPAILFSLIYACCGISDILFKGEM